MAPTDVVSSHRGGRAASPAPRKSAVAGPSNENETANVAPMMDHLSVTSKIGQVNSAESSPGPTIDVPVPVAKRCAMFGAFLPLPLVCIVATILVVGALLVTVAEPFHFMSKAPPQSVIVAALGVVVAAASCFVLYAAAPLAKKFVSKRRSGVVNDKNA